MDLLKINILVFVYLAVNTVYFVYCYSESRKELNYLNIVIEEQQNIICNLINSNDNLVDYKNLNENHVYRMQRIAGVKNPDTIFTYVEKIENPINTYKLIN